MSRSLKAILMLAMLLAVILAGILFSDLLRDRQALHDLEAQLADSRASWESIAEKREALQDELKVAEEALKEARLTLQESVERADSLRSDIEALASEIAAFGP